MKFYKILRKIYNELIYGAHLTALASMSIVLTFFILFNIDINIIALTIAYLTTFIVYSLDYQKDISIDFEINNEKVNYLVNRKNIYPYVIIGYILLDVIFLVLSLHIYENYSFVVFILILLTGGFLYTIGLKKITRYIPGFKSIYTTALWAYAGSFYIVYFNDLEFKFIYIIMFAFIFLKLLINSIFFDIKDVNLDKKYSLKTIPLVLGNNNTIFLLSLINILSLIILLYIVYIRLIPIYALSLALFFFYSEYYIMKGRNKSKAKILKYTYTLPDSEFVLWPIILLLSKMYIIHF
jgi:4-hydroxybenzoate polyprenyltransferase